MIALRLLLACLLLVPAAGQAAIQFTFTDRGAFVAAASPITSLPLATTGAPPVIQPSLSTGILTLSAIDGGIAGDGADIVSTELDADTLVLDFSRAVTGLGLFGGVVDEAFGFIDGVLLVTIDGETAQFDATGGPTFLGLLTDAAFTRATISVLSFDADASAVAFVGLQSQVDVAGVVPEPAAWALMILGVGLTGAALRRRAPVRMLA